MSTDCWQPRPGEAQLAEAVSLLTDGRAFWDAIYPHITEDGPDLNLADCEKITSWLAAHLAS